MRPGIKAFGVMGRQSVHIQNWEMRGEECILVWILPGPIFVPNYVILTFFLKYIYEKKSI